ncbi:hypothetical protein D3C75_1251130 [compost metagenome]
MQQGGAGLQRGQLFAVKYLGPVETQHAVVRPLVAVEQQPLVQTYQEDKARWLFGSEHGLADHFSHAQPSKRLGYRDVLVVQGL